MVAFGPHGATCLCGQWTANLKRLPSGGTLSK